MAWPGEYALFVSKATGTTRKVYEHIPPKDAESNVLPPWGYAWSPGSDRLAVWRSGNGTIVICRLEGAVDGKTSLTGKGNLVDLEWSSAGVLVSALDDGKGKHAIWIFDPDEKGAVPERVLERTGPILNLAISPNGKEVAFLAQDRETWSLFIVDVQEKGLRRLVKDLNGATRPTWPWYRASMRGEYPENQPRWSPDGKHITYADNSRIFVVNGDGSELKELRGRAKINSHF